MFDEKETALLFERVACKDTNKTCIVKDLDDDETIYWTGNKAGKIGVKRIETFYKKLGYLKYEK